MNINKIYLDKLCFYWRLKNHLEDKNIVPDFLPFGLDYDNKLKLIIQKRNKEVLKYLNIVYHQAPNIGNIQEGNQWSNLYGEDFLKFINTLTSENNKKVKKILEIGCGGCLLLKALQNKGFEVVGIDPSPFSYKEGKKRGVRVIQDSFPSNKLKEKFDLILSSDVLEHVVHPINFLKDQYNLLNDSGILVIATPDSSPNIINGDISIFLHQHLNYFDKESLKKTVADSGFGQVHIEKANYGGSLYCFAKKVLKIKRKDNPVDNTKINTFLKRYAEVISKLKLYIDKIFSDKESSFGFYAPTRALPYIAAMNLNYDFRFFDDTIYWHNKYFDGFPAPVENFEDIKKNPPTDILIMSLTFGGIIEKKIRDSLPNIKVKKLEDFLNI